MLRLEQRLGGRRSARPHRRELEPAGGGGAERDPAAVGGPDRPVGLEAEGEARQGAGREVEHPQVGVGAAADDHRHAAAVGAEARLAERARRPAEARELGPRRSRTSGSAPLMSGARASRRASRWPPRRGGCRRSGGRSARRPPRSRDRPAPRAPGGRRARRAGGPRARRRAGRSRRSGRERPRPRARAALARLERHDLEPRLVVGALLEAHREQHAAAAGEHLGPTVRVLARRLVELGERPQGSTPGLDPREGGGLGGSEHDRAVGSPAGASRVAADLGQVRHSAPAERHRLQLALGEERDLGRRERRPAARRRPCLDRRGREIVERAQEQLGRVAACASDGHARAVGRQRERRRRSRRAGSGPAAARG